MCFVYTINLFLLAIYPLLNNLPRSLLTSTPYPPTPLPLSLKTSLTWAVISFFFVVYIKTKQSRCLSVNWGCNQHISLVYVRMCAWWSHVWYSIFFFFFLFLFQLSWHWLKPCWGWSGLCLFTFIFKIFLSALLLVCLKAFTVLLAFLAVLPVSQVFTYFSLSTPFLMTLHMILAYERIFSLLNTYVLCKLNATRLSRICLHALVYVHLWMREWRRMKEWKWRRKKRVSEGVSSELRRRKNRHEGDWEKERRRRESECGLNK